jgi:hypothetical protein
MRGVSKAVRGVAVLLVVMSLAAPMQARPTWNDVARGQRDIVKMIQKWIAKAFGDGLIEPHPGTVTSTGDGLTEPHP